MALPDGWQIAGETHESGQAWVYCVRRPEQLDQLFALKRLKNPKRQQRFAREVETMIQLRSEHGIRIPQVVDTDLTAERPWFVMPWYEQGSLEQAIQGRRWDDDFAHTSSFLGELAGILADVHAAGVAHRDLKPSNVLLDVEGLYLTDFGLCLIIDDDTARVTDTQEAVGSRLYIAPENEAGINEEVDQRPADFYAFGKVIWAVLAQRQPLPRETVTESENRLAVVLDDIRFTALDDLIRDLLNPDPRARLTDWSVTLRELEATQRTIQGHPALIPQSTSEQAQRAARRLSDLPQVRSAIEEQRRKSDHEAWRQTLRREMVNEAQLVRSALDPITEHTGEILTMGPTTGGSPTESQLRESGHAIVRAMHASESEDADMATCFFIHSPQGIPALPTLNVRVWPVMHADELFVYRVPMLTPSGAPERVADFLVGGVADSIGPLPLLRRATIDEAVALVAQTSAIFVSLCEHYLEIVGAGDDPGNERTWEGRLITPAVRELVGSHTREDIRPPELRAFTITPDRVELKSTGTSLHVRARIVDDGAGVAGDGYTSSPSQARLRSPSGQIIDAMFVPRTLISGNAQDGVYEDVVTLAGEAERGVWRIEQVLVVDQVGNTHTYGSDELRLLGMTDRVEVR